MNERIQAQVSHKFSASPKLVCDAWLDPQKVRAWMGAALSGFGLSGDMQRVEIDDRVGGRFFFSDLRDGKEAQHWGTYLELDRPRKLAFTWMTDESQEANPSRVTVAIETDGDGCVATITHDMDVQWMDYVSRTEDGWSRMLRAIDSMTASRQ